MIHTSLILAAFEVTLAAGSAFAAEHVTGTVTRIDAVAGNIWLNTGIEFGVGTDLAASLLPGNSVPIVCTDDNKSIVVLSASPAN